MKNIMKNMTKLPKRIFIKLLKQTRLMEYYKKVHFVRNLNRDLSNKYQKKVLISYITAPLFSSNDFPTHTNSLEAIQILRYFYLKNYAVDVIHCLDDNNFSDIDKRDYNVIFGQGIPYNYACSKNPNATKILYLTEANPKISRQKEKERADYYFLRHKKRVNFYRANSEKFINDEAIKLSTHYILIGNDWDASTYPEIERDMFKLIPTGLKNEKFDLEKRDLNAARKNFVWFAGGGAGHKGLDILIDVFKNFNDKNLFVCGQLSKEEKRAFKFNYKNIFYLGFVNVQSNDFIDLMNKSAFIIFPSCAEGWATSVLTCMRHGLIPIITKESGIDLRNDMGYLLKDFKVETITEQIETISKQVDIGELLVKQKTVYEYANNTFNLNEFQKRISRIFDEILENNEGIK